MWKQIQYNLSRIFILPFIDVEKNPRIQKMKSGFEKAGGTLIFTVKIYDNEWVAECKQIKGIVTGGKGSPTQEEVDDNVKDAIFTSFGIPAYLCKDSLIRNKLEPEKKTVSSYLWQKTELLTKTFGRV
jgi:predicted RNase H-like HicB family nuclease